MSLQYTSPAGEDCLNLHCPKCQNVVMVGTLEEIGSLACAGVIPLCFNCHPLPADKVYHGLVDEEKQVYLICLDGKPFLFSWVYAGEKYGPCLIATKIQWADWFALKTGIADVSPLSS